ncbi:MULTISPECIES: Tgt2/MlaC family protein [Desulfovibrio]|uniref:Phospholipid transport system substrate-binding protein n=3 Tax=Desulfovibrio TaxID=872 RepID=A0AA94L3B3_DESDE|nr:MULTISPECIES: ABC transporter substrate-binding protein [Desulfovibrio]ATD81967.1 organic solvent ABC transporter permease [Desulfovibrio sp. G11]MDY0204094.1 ABC transporter substrate-binding protein [Desulfovibrio desulfuricans]SFW70488.1 phospholipid transport system substrate-binding protein [Desulfovibrio desulfuricans]SPD34716.1 Phospholypid removal system, MlaC [Desulfovibrio sp. G11]
MFTHALPRRITIALCAFLLTLVLLPAGAQANSPARQSLETATNRILNFIKNPDYVNPATRGPIRQQIEDEVLHIFDFSEFSSRTVGPRWRNFTAQQKREFSDAFADLLINTYLNKIDGYNGEQVLYTGEVSSAKGDRTEVRTVVTMKDGKKVPVAYRMLPKNGKWLVYDVLIENISLVKNYRTQFQDILNTDSPENLIARIKAKAMEVRQEHGK